jgi:hypothetical protein
MITTTTVLIAVAKLEFTPFIPTFASIEVSAAKIEDNNANNNHMEKPPCYNNIASFFPTITPTIQQQTLRTMYKPPCKYF